jgi:hypothetical protein
METLNMRISTAMCVGFFGLLLQAGAGAQIYESRDAEGVPEFSDTPTMGAEVVDLPATNTVEAPPEEPVAARPAPAAAQTGAAGETNNTVLVEEGGDGMYYGEDADDDGARAQRRVDEARINNALPDGPQGVGNPDPGYGKLGPGVEHHAPAVHR